MNSKKSSLLNLFHNQQDILFKYEMAKPLIFTGDEQIYQFLLSDTILEIDQVEHLIFFGAPKERPRLVQYILSHQDDVESLCIQLKQLEWAGDPYLMTLYLKLLAHPEVKIREQAMRLMINFFSEPQGVHAEQLLRQENCWDLIENSVYNQAQKFWIENQSDVNSILKYQRYFGFEAFDLNKMASRLFNVKYWFDLELNVDRLIVWSGSEFAYNLNALLSRQLQQLQEIQSKIKANHHNQKGQWLFFGKSLA